MGNPVGVLAAVAFAALVGLILLSLMAIVLSGPKRRADESAGEVVLRYGPWERFWIGMLALAGPAFVLTVVIFDPPRSPVDVLSAEGALLLYKSIGWAAIRQFFWLRVVVSEDGIERHSPWPWGRASFIGWEEVVAVNHRRSQDNSLIFTATDRREIGVPLRLVGLPALVDAVRRKLKPEIYAGAAAELRRIEEVEARRRESGW